jgi:hypothetical protein
MKSKPEQDVQHIIEFSKVIEMYENKIKEIKSKVNRVLNYTRILQEGDPDNENPKKILDYIEYCLKDEMEKQ